jgi:hypothetical protein
MEKPSYYAIIPANVRYADIKANAKLLYGEITALSNQKGYCWSSNNYFAELYGVSKNTISLWINQLKKHGFIHVEVIRDKNKQVIKRTMSIIKNDDRSPTFKEDAIIKNDEYNSINKNNTIINISNREKSFEMDVFNSNENILDKEQQIEFIEFWTEKNKSETKMKFELETTWNTKKRMLRWKRNNEKWNKKPSGSSKISNAHNEWMKAKEFIQKQK